MTPWWLFGLTWSLAYLIGAVPFGYLVARARGVDIFVQGSGNIGATNVGRVLGKRLGILVFLLDFAKGALPVVGALAVKPLALEMDDSGWTERGVLELGTGLAAFLGHVFPVYLRFRGGKGVATGAGTVLVLCPVPALGALGVWVVVVAATRYVSLASVAAALALCALQAVTSGDWAAPKSLFCLLAGGLIIVRHRGNLARLARGNENRIKETAAMRQLGKALHVLALGLWFGACIFFTFVVALSLFHTFRSLGEAGPRPNWLPLPAEFARVDAEVNGPREQGGRVAGTAVGPLFHWYYLVQGVCGLIALFTALSWSRGQGRFVDRLRAGLLLAAVILVLAGWPLEQRVSRLREPRNQAMDAYLQADSTSAAARIQAMRDAEAEFFRWHTYSMLANFATVVLVTAGMALAAWLPGEVIAEQKGP